MKVIELLNKIANKEIKRGSIIKYRSKEFLYDYPNACGIYEVGKPTSNINNLFYYLDSKNLNEEIKLIEENQDIDIQEIEELDINDYGSNIEAIEAIIEQQNQILKWAKQLDRQINNN